MTIPGFTAESSVYKMNVYYQTAGVLNRAGGIRDEVRLANGTSTGPIVFHSACDLALQRCYQSAQGSGYDPSGWCDWWKANCRPVIPNPGGGDSGSSCGPGCWDNGWGTCICHTGPKVR
jgi:hypothetical protein